MTRTFSRTCLKLVLFLILFSQIVFAREKSLEKDIADGYLDDYSKIEAAFILSGASADSMDYYLDWYNQLLTRLKEFNLEFNQPAETARIIFTYLHSQWLKTYAKESTTLIDITRNKEFNCVSATILYNLLCEDLSIDCEAFETPTHVYTIFNDFNNKLIVENTNDMGFNIMKNLKEYSKYLSRYYPQREVLKIGLDRLYYHENSKGRTINNTELLGLLAYNRAYFAREKSDFKTAYDFVLLAQSFNQDSRSNYNFEMGLYYDWGNELYKSKKFNDAFTVFADAYYRYPDNKDFLNNTLVMFYNSQRINWDTKNWPESKRLIEEIIDLTNLDQKERAHIEGLLMNWSRYFNSLFDKKSSTQVMELINKLKDV
jgi:hypothetical protein